MEEKYVRTTVLKLRDLLKDLCVSKVEGSVDNILDRFEKPMIESRKMDLTQNLNYVMTLQLIERMEMNGEISSAKRNRNRFSLPSGPSSFI